MGRPSPYMRAFGPAVKYGAGAQESSTAEIGSGPAVATRRARCAFAAVRESWFVAPLPSRSPAAVGWRAHSFIALPHPAGRRPNGVSATTHGPPRTTAGSL